MKHTTTRSASDYRAQARKALKGRWESVVVPYVLAVFAAAMLTAFLCMILWIITVDEAVTTLGVYIGAVIAFPLIVGFCHICLRVLKSRKRISGDQIMFGYKRCSMPAILAPTIIYLMLLGISVAFGFATGFLGTLIWSVVNVFLNVYEETVLGIVFCVLAVPLCAVIIRLYCTYAMYPFILAEHPNLRTLEVLRRSKEMMRGNRWKFFCLNLSFIGWVLLSVLSLGIGYLFLTPYVVMSQAAFYRDLAREDRLRHPFRGWFRRRSR